MRVAPVSQHLVSPVGKHGGARRYKPSGVEEKQCRSQFDEPPQATLIHGIQHRNAVSLGLFSRNALRAATHVARGICRPRRGCRPTDGVALAEADRCGSRFEHIRHRVKPICVSTVRSRGHERNAMELNTDTQRAIKIVAPGRIAAVDGVSIPAIGSDEVLVGVKAIAINPFDGKSAELSPTHMATVGCDYSGIVIAVGNDMGKAVKVGDGVCGFVFGNNPYRQDNGAFAQFVAAPADLVMCIPAAMEFEAAATLGVGMATAGLVLYGELGLPMPMPMPIGGAAGGQSESRGYALVSGGSTATGTLLIQMLRL